MLYGNNIYVCRYGVANESAPVAVSGVSCPGSYLWHFMRCNVDYEVSDNDCTHQKDVAVACSKLLIAVLFYTGIKAGSQ